MVKNLLVLLLVFVSALCVAQTNSTSAAKVELGALLGGQFAPEYRGSEYYAVDLLPLPYVYYQSRLFKVDRDGVRGEFWRRARWQLNVSLDGALGGSGNSSPYRQGMEELESAVELGPSLELMLGGRSFEDGWILRMPVRAVFSIGKQGIGSIGYVFNPRISWRRPLNANNWRFSAQTGILFADQRYHEYFYGVRQSESLPWRPAYQAKSGYSGAYARFNYYHQRGLWRWGVSLRYDYLSGAEFIDSPLVETDHYASIAFVVMRKLWSREL